MVVVVSDVKFPLKEKKNQLFKKKQYGLVERTRNIT